MSKNIKSNLFIIGVLLFLGLISTLLNTFTYIERRIFGILISVIEVLVVLALAKRQNMTLRDMGLRRPIKPIAWVIGIVVALIPMFLIVILNSGNLGVMFPQKVSLTICVIQTIYYFVIVAPTEEIIFRGFILENFNKSFTENMSILLTSFLFAFIHIFNGSIMNIVMAFIISVLYCKAKLLSHNHSLYPCMIGHAFNDSLNQWLPYFLL